MRVQQESGITGDRKLVHRQRVQHFRSLELARGGTGGSNFGETVGDIKDEDDEETIRRTLDLKVPEEGVGTEEV